MPKFKSGLWNGYINLFSNVYGTLYTGLVPQLTKFCEERKYELVLEDGIGSTDTFSIDQAKGLFNSFKLDFTAREDQCNLLSHAISSTRSTLVSPTASGKSAILYALCRHYHDKTMLLIVPTVNLVEQMYSDFIDYSKNNEFKVVDNVHRIYQGQDKQTTKRIILSTWQSLYKLPKIYFEQFDVLVFDECHMAKADCIKAIGEKCINAKYRFGLTGTLDNSLCNELVIQGLLGKKYQSVTTKQLMDQNNISKLQIKCIKLKYPEEECKNNKKLKYQDEIKYLIANKQRNIFISNLAVKQKNNTLVLYRYVENHGKLLFKLIENKAKGRKVFFISGQTKADVREEVRKIVQKEKDAIIVASEGVFSTGTNIPNLHNVIFASPSKTRIRVLQSIGRVLRKAEDKDIATLYDIADDMQWKTKKNYSLTHFIERFKIYSEEKFDCKLYNLNL